MKRCIKRIERLSVSQRQWLWFVTLWCGGLLTVFTLAQLIRLAMGIEN